MGASIAQLGLNCAVMEPVNSGENYKIEALVNEHCACGENPLWHEDHKMIYWEDIPDGYIFRLVKLN